MIQNNNLAKLVAAMALAPFVVDAHMIMASPKPYGAPTKAPLEPDGSNFPCQNVAYTGTSNQWPAGSTQQLSFELHDSAVHGGGSCQISVTKDKNPTKNSKWKVIHSIEGGCPYNTAGNLPEDGSVTIPAFPFKVPNDLPNGDMSMAWTWFNRIGNREMYMNCAPITVTGSTGTDATLNALPDMAVANINAGSGATCKTTENFEYIFANPGQSVVNNMAANPSGGTYQFEPLCGGSPTTGPPAGSPPAGNPPAGSAPAASAPAASAPAASGAPTTTMKTVTAAPAPTPVGGKAPPAESKAPVSAPAAQPSAPAAPQNPSGGNSSSCPTDGAVVCKGDSMFAICDHGVANFMPVAQGTTCKGGVISKRNPHMHRHLRRSF